MHLRPVSTTWPFLTSQHHQRPHLVPGSPPRPLKTWDIPHTSQMTSLSLTCPHMCPPSCLEGSASPSDELSPTGLSISLSGSSILLTAGQTAMEVDSGLWLFHTPSVSKSHQLCLHLPGPWLLPAPQPQATLSTTATVAMSSTQTATTGPQGLPQRRSHIADFCLLAYVTWGLTTSTSSPPHPHLGATEGCLLM